MSKDKVQDILRISRAEAIQALYNGFFRAKERGAYTVKQMLADGLDELIKETKAKPKYYRVCEDWEGGGGFRREVYDTEEEAVQAVKNSFFKDDIVVKGEIVYSFYDIEKEFENASKN